MRKLLDEIRVLVTEGGFDLVVVDTPPGVESHPVELRMLIRESDFVVLTTQQANADLDSVTEWSKTIRREGVQFTFLLGRVRLTAHPSRARRRSSAWVIRCVLCLCWWDG